MQLDLDPRESEWELSAFGQSSVPPPGFVIEPPPATTVFLRNLKDLLWTAEQPRLRLASKPGEFWPDVFVASGVAWGRFFESLALHGLMAGVVWLAILILPRPPQIVERSTFHREDVVFYSASDYLPPLDTGGAHIQAKGDPALAPQPIISVPPEADNRTQTIVAPPSVKLNRDVPLPNVVALPQRTMPVPIEATSRPARAPAVNSLDMTVVAPAPDVATASARRTLQAPQSAVIAPPPTVDPSIRRMADLNIGRTEVVAPAPQLPLEAQRSLDHPTLDHPTLGSGTPGVVPPSPSVQAAALSSSGDRLIALGIHPIAVSGPIEPPGGNRRGTFAATPLGRLGAAGTPDSGPAENHGPGSNGTGGNAGHGVGHGEDKDIPTGLHVGTPANSATQSTVAGSGSGGGTGGNGSPSANSPFLLAKAMPPRVTALPTRTPEVPSNETEEEKKVFGDRKFYAMTVNMPNLNSAGGSWVIHFAERDQTDEKGELTAPHAMAIADPGYPLELMKQNIQGTVTLYAMIRSDGSVGNIRVLRSVDDQLDKYASDALARWVFRPATKNGSAVDLEAVVTIPFKPAKIRPSF